jgi:hypothetical protein
LSPPELGGEVRLQCDSYAPVVRDRREQIVRQVPLVISHQYPLAIAAEAACQRDLDVLIDACGAGRVLVRHFGLRTSMVSGSPGPVTGTLRVSIYLIDQAAE